jgi:relaxase-like protein
VIVKKTQGAGISGAVRYVTGEGKRDPVTGIVPGLAPGAASRVAWVGGTGFGFAVDRPSRVETARRVMEWMAQTQTSKTRKCRDDCVHLMLSWPDGENPPRAEMEAAARSLLGTLGMEEARAVFAAHTDTGHSHVHIVASRIDPQSGKAFRNSHDTIAMAKWALAYERQHGGVRCEGRVSKSPPASSHGMKRMRGEGRAGNGALASSTNVEKTNKYKSTKHQSTNYQSTNYKTNTKQQYNYQTNTKTKQVSYEVQAERDMIAETARPYREQITQEGTLTMNGMPWWLPVAIIFAVYITMHLWHLYHAQHGNSSTPDQRTL